MANKEMPSESDSRIGRVLIPNPWSEELREYFSALRLELLTEAAKIASQQHMGDGLCYVSRQDIIESARVIFSRADGELDQALTRDEPHYVREAS